MATPLLDPAGPWRFDALGDLPDDGRRYEVVDGHLVVTPPPSHRHQLVAAALLQQLTAACPPQWRAVHEFALQLGDDGRVPDLAVVRASPSGSAGPYAWQAPDFGLVVEVMSPGSRKTDLFAKPGEYAEAGIPLLWRVDLDPSPVLHAFRLEAGAYLPVRTADGAPVPWGLLRVDVPALGR